LEAQRGRFRPRETEREWEAGLREWAAAGGHKPGAAFMTMRLAVTGARRSPPIYPFMQVLGPAEVERRLGLAIDALG
ncbi:MAG: glutamate--tRNA ligase, partial [Actinomycetota bacterium]|nr:glutamate--tRNA ligase [Actinomycetota bacterium]